MPDGKIKHVYIVGQRVSGESGDFAEFVGTVIDVTERRRAEEERQALAHANRVATMGQLTASIAHEVNQPIATDGNLRQDEKNFVGSLRKPLRGMSAAASGGSNTSRCGISGW
jgi:hypothetical protein